MEVLGLDGGMLLKKKLDLKKKIIELMPISSTEGKGWDFVNTLLYFNIPH